MRAFSGNKRIGVALLVAGLAGLAGCPTPAPDMGVPAGDQDGQSGDPVPAEPGFSSALFVMAGNTGFVSFDDVQVKGGTSVAVTTELTSEDVKAPRDAVLDKYGNLYILNAAHDGSVAIYDNPLTAGGNRPPDRIVSGAATGISRSPTGIAIDHDNDLLYVSNLLEGVVVFDISVPGGFDGNVAPVRTFEVDLPLFRPEQIRLADGSLYVADTRGGTTDIVVFDDPGSLVQEVVPDRFIECEAFDNRIGFDIDPFGRMLVGSRDPGLVLIFNNAADLDGPVTADVELTIAGTSFDPMPSFVLADSQDRLYVSDANNNMVFAYDLSTELTSGNLLPDRVIDSDELIVPARMLLFEYLE